MSKSKNPQATITVEITTLNAMLDSTLNRISHYRQAASVYYGRGDVISAERSVKFSIEFQNHANTFRDAMIAAKVPLTKLNAKRFEIAI